MSLQQTKYFYRSPVLQLAESKHGDSSVWYTSVIEFKQTQASNIE